ncbi:CNT_collapsed_G0015680.mRNA.1.CDS.1 [Saccharomyces cerevisiae]|nr:CNT_collapsed_G0015680.mRNA.1.CDS.1 [Saccharomyces cerevisiae]
MPSRLHPSLHEYQDLVSILLRPAKTKHSRTHERRGISTIILGPPPSWRAAGGASGGSGSPFVVPNFMISQDSPVQAARHLAVSIWRTCLVLHLVVGAAVAVEQAGRHVQTI